MKTERENASLQLKGDKVFSRGKVCLRFAVGKARPDTLGHGDLCFCGLAVGLDLNGELSAKQIIQETPYQNLSAIPANTLLTSAEFELFDFDDSEFRMKKALEEVKDEFDYIFIDCPPSLGRLTVNALTASDGIIVPMQCEFYALEGLSQLMITVQLIKKHYNPDLNVSGILLTMHNARLLLSMQVVNELKKHYEDKLFETKISRNVKLSEAPSFGMPVYYHDKNAKGAKEYLEAAKEVAARI